MTAGDSVDACRYILVQPHVEQRTLHIYAEFRVDEVPSLDPRLRISMAERYFQTGLWKSARFEGKSARFEAGEFPKLTLPLPLDDSRLERRDLWLEIELQNLDAEHDLRACPRTPPGGNSRQKEFLNGSLTLKAGGIGLSCDRGESKLAVCDRALMIVRIQEKVLIQDKAYPSTRPRDIATVAFYLEPIMPAARPATDSVRRPVAVIHDERKRGEGRTSRSGGMGVSPVVRDVRATADRSARKALTSDGRPRTSQSPSPEREGAAGTAVKEVSGRSGGADNLANESAALPRRLREVEAELRRLKSDLRGLKHEVNTQEAARRKSPELDSQAIREVVSAQSRSLGLTQEFVRSMADLHTEVHQSGSRVQEGIQTVRTRLAGLDRRVEELERRLAARDVSSKQVELTARSVLAAEVRSALRMFESGASGRDPMRRKRALLAALADELKSTGGHGGLVADLETIVGAEATEPASPEQPAATGSSIAQLLVLLIRSVQAASQTTHVPLDDGACIAALHKVGGICVEQPAVVANRAIRDAWVRALEGWGLRPEEPPIGRQLQRERALNKGRDPASPHRRNEVAQVLRPALIRDSDGEVREPAWVLLGAST